MIARAALALMLTAMPAVAAPLLHPMFADHAVLQRDKPVRIYGQAKAGSSLTVTMGAARATARAGRDGGWSTTLPAMAAGGPYELNVSGGGETETVHDVLVGDVFLCTGQSNMQLSVRRAANAEAEIAAATDSQVRELAIERVPSPAPLKVFTKPVTWNVESPQTAGDFSASCFYFAKELRKTVKAPIGLVVAAWGGTRDRGWVSGPGLRALGYYDDDLDMLALYQRDPAAASRRWDTAWESWWRSGAADMPWKDDTSGWPTAPQGLGPWHTWPGLTLPDGTAEEGVGFVGQLWLATHVTLSAAQAAMPATLDLGNAVEEEKSWVNGRGVGGSSLEPAALHPLPKGLLQAGDNSIVANIFCSWKNCGLSGPPASRAIRFADGSSVVLDGTWRYRPVAARIAPQLPWGPMHGIGLQYNGMVAPIGPYTVRGAIWYQGESNIYFAQHYHTTLATMIQDWRGQFGADLPFLVVQIPDYGPTPDRPSPSLWSDVREAQRRVVEADAHAALVVTLDIGDPKVLHPSNKQELGRRLAVAARHTVYGEAVAPSGPRVLLAQQRSDNVVVSFRDVTGALTAYNGTPSGFELCGATQGSCRAAHASLRGNTVVLDGSGARLRYCWGDSPVCSLSDASGLPAGPFELAVGP